MAVRNYNLLIDIKRDIFEIIKVKQIDTGNNVTIKLLEDGIPVDLTGQTLKFVAKKADGKGIYNFVEVTNAKAGECLVKLTSQALAVAGELACELELEGKELITTLTFYIEVVPKINDGKFIESTNEFTVLQKAISDAYKAIETMETNTDAKLEEMDQAIEHMETVTNNKVEEMNTAIADMEATADAKMAEVDKAVRDMNTATNSKLTEVQDQVDSAVADMNATTTNKLTQVQTQVNTAISNMNTTTDNKLTEVQTQVNTAVDLMNQTTNDKLDHVQEQIDTAVVDMEIATNNKINEVDERIAKTIETIETQVDNSLRDNTIAVDNKLAEVQAETTETLTNIQAQVDAEIVELDTKFETLETELNSKVDGTVDTLNNAVAEAEAKLTDIDTAVSNANTAVEEMKTDVAEAITGIDDRIDSRVDERVDGKLDAKLDKTGGDITGPIKVAGNIEITKAGSNFVAPNNYGLMGRDTAGTAQYLLYMDTSNKVHLGYQNRGIVLDADNPAVRGGHLLYHQGYKPTAQDVGALPLTGGTVDGQLTIENTGNLITFQTERPWVLKQGLAGAESTLDLVPVGNDKKFRIMDPTGTRGLVTYVGGSATQVTIDGNLVYHKGYKPTPADIGALATTGGILSGPLTMGSNQIRGANGTAMLRDFGNGNVVLSAGKTPEGVAGTLYLGYNSGTDYATANVRLETPLTWKGTSTILVDSDGKIPYSAIKGGPTGGGGTGGGSGTVASPLTGNLVMQTPAGRKFDVITQKEGDTNGTGIAIQGGGITIVGSGESAVNLMKTIPSMSTEMMYVSSDTGIIFATDCQNINDRVTTALEPNGTLRVYGEVYASGYQVYHKGHKPTATEVGALGVSTTYSQLTTTDKTVLGAINELKASGGSGGSGGGAGGAGQILNDVTVSNANSLNTSGFAYTKLTYISGATEAPFMQMTLDGDKYKAQLFHDWKTNTLYTKSRYDGVWSSVSKIFSSLGEYKDLQTKDKTLLGAINELNTRLKYINYTEVDFMANFTSSSFTLSPTTATATLTGSSLKVAYRVSFPLKMCYASVTKNLSAGSYALAITNGIYEGKQIGVVVAGTETKHTVGASKNDLTFTVSTAGDVVFKFYAYDMINGGSTSGSVDFNNITLFKK